MQEMLQVVALCVFVRIQKGDDKIALIGVENWGQNFKRQVILIKLLTGSVKKILKFWWVTTLAIGMKLKSWEEFSLNIIRSYARDAIWNWDPRLFQEFSSICLHTMGRLVWELGAICLCKQGFGFHAYPGRVGIMPEITVIELKKVRM
jgi:hypothetical protein